MLLYYYSFYYHQCWQKFSFVVLSKSSMGIFYHPNMFSFISSSPDSQRTYQCSKDSPSPISTLTTRDTRHASSVLYSEAVSDARSSSRWAAPATASRLHHHMPPPPPCTSCSLTPVEERKDLCYHHFYNFATVILHIKLGFSFFTIWLSEDFHSDYSKPMYYHYVCITFT